MSGDFVSIAKVAEAQRYTNEWEQFFGYLSEKHRARITFHHTHSEFVIEVYEQPGALKHAEVDSLDADGRLVILHNIVSALNRGDAIPASVFDDLWWKPKGGAA